MRLHDSFRTVFFVYFSCPGCIYLTLFRIGGLWQVDEVLLRHADEVNGGGGFFRPVGVVDLLSDEVLHS